MDDFFHDVIDSAFSQWEAERWREIEIEFDEIAADYVDDVILFAFLKYFPKNALIG